MYYCCGISDKGIMPHNEDALLIHKTVITDNEAEFKLSCPFFTGVCDGVSGELSGEVASKKCLEFLRTIKFSKRFDLNKKILSVHHELKKTGISCNSTINMQTTLCGLGIDEEHNIHTVNVGDSRLYLFRNSSLKQISRDQSLVQMLYEEGAITSDEKRTHAQRNIIFPVLGNVSSIPKPDVQVINEKMQYGDLFLLCTDGLSDYVTNSEIEEILSLPLKLSKRLKLLVEIALKNGGRDNITIIGICLID